MDMSFYIGIAMIFLFIIGIVVWLVRDYMKEPKDTKDYPFKHKK